MMESPAVGLMMQLSFQRQLWMTPRTQVASSKLMLHKLLLTITNDTPTSCEKETENSETPLLLNNGSTHFSV